METTNEREAAWCAQYDLVRSIPATSISYRCVLPLIGQRCRSRWHRACAYDLPHTLGDHGRFYRRPGERRPLLFLGQPYGALDDEALDTLARVRSLGLFVRIGERGAGWYYHRTFPVIVSCEPIPAHCYRWTAGFVEAR